MTTPSGVDASTTTAGEADGEAPRIKWLPLEADPVLLAEYVNHLGGPISCSVEDATQDTTEIKHEAPEALLSFEDVLSLEDWAIDMARNPTVAVLLVYPLRDDNKLLQKQQQEQQLSKNEEDGIWFTKQTVRNACGTVALLHCIANLPRDRFPLQPNGILETFYSRSCTLTSAHRSTTKNAGI